MKKNIFMLLAGIIVGLSVGVSPVGAQTKSGLCTTLTCGPGTTKEEVSGITNICICKSLGPDELAVTDEKLDLFDPLKVGGSEHAETLSTPGGIISRLLGFAFPLAGMILFVMIVMGGFQVLTGAGNQKATEAGRQRVTMAVVGFLLLFASYWIVQILEQIFNIKIV